MKNIKSILSASLLTFSLLGCQQTISNPSNSSNSKTNHAHAYTTTMVAATCTEKGYTLHSCSFGDDSYKDNYTDALGHSFIEGEKNWYCSRCNKNETDGYEFSLSKWNGEDCYVVRKSSVAILADEIASIPRKYESLPVREIATYSLSSIQKNVKKLIIHDNIKRIDDYLWNGTSIWQSDLTSKSTLEEVQFDSTCSNMSVCAKVFYNCPSLTRINLSKGMIGYIPSSAETAQNGGTANYLFKDTPYFKNNAKVMVGSYYINDLLLYVDFNEVTSNLNIADGTVAINSLVYYKNTIVKTLTIPESVKQIYDRAFGSCKNLQTITYKGTTSQFKNIYFGGTVFSDLKANSISCTDGLITTYQYNGYTYHVGE